MTLTATDAAAAYAALKLFPFQVRLVQLAVNRNGIVVLPCGMGKTRVALGVMLVRHQMFHRRKAVFVADTEQAAHQVLMAMRSFFPQNKRCCVALCTTQRKTRPLRDASLFVTTYGTLKRGVSQCVLDGGIGIYVHKQDVHTAVFDEAHGLPADGTKVVLDYIVDPLVTRAFGLTATLVREDDKIPVAISLLGAPFPVPSVDEMRATGLLSNVIQTSIALSRRGCDRALRVLLRAPAGEPTLVYFDRLVRMRKFAEEWSVPFVCGGMQASEVETVLLAFAAGDITVVACTTSMDQAMDFGALRVIITVGVDNAGRRQANQRRGRLRGEGGKGGDPNRYFYVLHSPETQAFVDARFRHAIQSGAVAEAVVPWAAQRGGEGASDDVVNDDTVFEAAAAAAGGRPCIPLAGEYAFSHGDVRVRSLPRHPAELAAGDELLVRLQATETFVRVCLATEDTPRLRVQREVMGAAAQQATQILADGLLLRDQVGPPWPRLVRDISNDPAGCTEAARAFVLHLRACKHLAPPGLSEFAKAVELACFLVEHAESASLPSPSSAPTTPIVDAATGTVLLKDPWTHAALHAAAGTVWRVGLPPWLRDRVAGQLSVAPRHVSNGGGGGGGGGGGVRPRGALSTNNHLAGTPVADLILFGRERAEMLTANTPMSVEHVAELAAAVFPPGSCLFGALQNLAAAHPTPVCDRTHFSPEERRVLTQLRQHAIVAGVRGDNPRDFGWRLVMPLADAHAAIVRLIEAAAEEDHAEDLATQGRDAVRSAKHHGRRGRRRRY